MGKKGGNIMCTFKHGSDVALIKSYNMLLIITKALFGVGEGGHMNLENDVWGPEECFSVNGNKDLDKPFAKKRPCLLLMAWPLDLTEFL